MFYFKTSRMPRVRVREFMVIEVLIEMSSHSLQISGIRKRHLGRSKGSHLEHEHSIASSFVLSWLRTRSQRRLGPDRAVSARRVEFLPTAVLNRFLWIASSKRVKWVRRPYLLASSYLASFGSLQW
mmetsp:Transcript_11727/g.23887  ORF Transcript_11727/g.23887 Transcript_11727/m.23887 type:complete len:126 (+) Transcript_11727:1506-1883(+)